MHFIRLVFVSAGYILSLLILQQGFLSQKTIFKTKSSCQDVSAGSDCWMQPKYKRAIVILIDALRHDFIQRSDSSDKLFMPKTERLLQDSSKNRLLRFMADAPTTTMQRVTAMLTGNFPAFIEAGCNFAAAAIEEDNILYQLKARNTTTLFYGDDTWLSLAPGLFTEEVGFDSFNVKDLDTVDQGVTPLLLNAAKTRKDYSLLVGHFLGVDHCGHRYGPDHPEMQRKLNEMDTVVHEVISSVDKDTVVFVLGDHGMTKTGDHGGDTELETTAALFIHSPKGLSTVSSESVKQIDLAPTLATLLDFPIPFSNLGVVIPDLFENSTLIKARSLNSRQIIRYVDGYKNDDPLVQKDAKKTITYYEQASATNPNQEDYELMLKLRDLVKNSIARYDADLVRTGALSFVETLVLNAALYFNCNDSNLFVFMIYHSAMLFLRFSVYFHNKDGVLIFNVSAYLSILYSIFVLFFATKRYSNLRAISTMTVASLYGVSSFSNSFVVYNADTTRFLCATALVIALYVNSKELCKRRFISPAFWVIAKNVALILLSTRLGFLTQKCREEQVGCEEPLFAVEFLQLSDNSYKLVRLVSSGLALLWFVYRNPKHITHPNNDTQVTSALIKLLCILTYLNWLCELHPDDQVKLFELYSAQLCAFTLSILFVYVYFKAHKDDVLELWRTLFCMLVFLLGGNGLAVQVVIVWTVLHQLNLMSQTIGPLEYSIYSAFLFPALSHNPLFSAIPFRAAFVLFSGKSIYQNLQGFCVLLHLYAGHILTTITVFEARQPNIAEGYLFLNALQAGFTAYAAVLHRKHLMMYKIFAPNFIFTGVSLILVCVLLVVLKGALRK